MNETIKTWLKMSAKELDNIYKAQQPAGKIPEVVDSKGTALFCGPKFSGILAFTAKLLWKGKSFYIENDTQKLINRITPFGLHAFIADVYHGSSKLDNKPTIVIDYSKTSFFCKFIRDEIREIEPRLYLGKVWDKDKEIGHFALKV